MMKCYLSFPEECDKCVDQLAMCCVCSADEYTLQYMEDHRTEYPVADWQLALNVARDHLAGESSTCLTLPR